MGKETERQRIKENLQQHITPDDVVAAMFSFFEEEQFPLDARKIHSVIYKIKKEYPQMLEEFSFSENDVYPFSRLLEKVLFRLQNSTLIRTVGPDFEVGLVPNESKQYIRKNILPLFKNEDRERLEQMGKRFEELFTA